MDLLAGYGSETDSVEPNTFSDGDVRATNSCPELEVDAAQFKRRKLETGRFGITRPPEQQAAEQTCTLPDPIALLSSNHAATNLRTGYSHPLAPASCRSNSGDAPQQAVSASTAGASAGTANGARNGQAEPARIRIFPHVEGNYATVVFVPVPTHCAQELQQLATSLILQCPSVPAAQGPAADTNGIAPGDPACCNSIDTDSQASNTVLRLWPTFSAAAAAHAALQTSSARDNSATRGSSPSDLTPAQLQEQQQQQLPLHMSLSRTVPIKHIQIASLKAALSKQLKPFKPFRAELQGLVSLVNDSRTRTFVCIKVAKGYQQVVKMVGGVDRAFVTHGLPTFYQEPLPHVSLAWAPGDQRHLLQPWLDTFQHMTITMQVSQALCRVGKVQDTVWEP